MESLSMNEPSPNVILEENPKFNVSYDARTGFFNYSLPNDSGFSMTAPMGTVSNHAVTVKTYNGAFINRYCEDNENVEVEGANENGKEIVEFLAERTTGYNFELQSKSGKDGKYERYKSRLSFCIIDPDVPTRMSLLKAPYGFEIGEMLIDGKQREIYDKDNIILTEDGDYTVIFYPVSVEGAGNYTIKFKRDTTAPYMIFSEDINKGEIEGTLFFHPSETDAKVAVYRNGKILDTVPDGISAGGNYHIEVSDSLYNKMDYYFTVKSKEHSSIVGYAAFFTVLIAICALIYLISKRRLRVL